MDKFKVIVGSLEGLQNKKYPQFWLVLKLISSAAVTSKPNLLRLLVRISLIIARNSLDTKRKVLESKKKSRSYRNLSKTDMEPTLTRSAYMAFKFLSFQ